MISGSTAVFPLCALLSRPGVPCEQESSAEKSECRVTVEKMEGTRAAGGEPFVPRKLLVRAMAMLVRRKTGNRDNEAQSRHCGGRK